MASDDATEVALRALRRRDLSRQELEQKLARAGVAEGQRMETVDRLADAGLVSDARYAEERARVLAGRGSGDDAIRADLRRHGIGRDVIEDVLGGLAPEAERAAAHFARRGSGERALRFLARKGFTREVLETLEAANRLN